MVLFPWPSTTTISIKIHSISKDLAPIPTVKSQKKAHKYQASPSIGSTVSATPPKWFTPANSPPQPITPYPCHTLSLV